MRESQEAFRLQEEVGRMKIKLATLQVAGGMMDAELGTALRRAYAALDDAEKAVQTYRFRGRSDL